MTRRVPRWAGVAVAPVAVFLIIWTYYAYTRHHQAVLVDQTMQGQAIGPALLRDAVLRTIQAAEIAGIRAILVHAISDRAKGFYERSGFIPSPIDPMTLMITVVAEARKALTGQ